ncbi:hypothetical protein [Flavisolibacter ginsenosidimutans]|nr:hypothetical protein [Flavisolibacter ginsenosidimutans]
MKRILLLAGLVTVLILSLSSCASQRDCQGRSHVRLSNGVVL